MNEKLPVITKGSISSILSNSTTFHTLIKALKDGEVVKVTAAGSKIEINGRLCRARYKYHYCQSAP